MMHHGYINGGKLNNKTYFFFFSEATEDISLSLFNEFHQHELKELYQ